MLRQPTSRNIHNLNKRKKDDALTAAFFCSVLTASQLPIILYNSEESPSQF